MRGYAVFTAYTGFSVVLANDPVNLLWVSPALQTPDTLDEREINDCALSVFETDLIAPTPTNSELADWFHSAWSNVPYEECEPTVPASLSDAYLDHWEAVGTYLETAPSVAAEITTDCGFTFFALSLPEPSCGPSVTVHFEDGESDASSIVVAAVVIANATVLIGEGGNSGGSYIASRKTAIASAAMTLLAFIGVAVFL